MTRKSKLFPRTESLCKNIPPSKTRRKRGRQHELTLTTKDLTLHHTLTETQCKRSDKMRTNIVRVWSSSTEFVRDTEGQLHTPILNEGRQ